MKKTFLCSSPLAFPRTTPPSAPRDMALLSITASSIQFQAGDWNARLGNQLQGQRGHQQAQWKPSIFLVLVALFYCQLAPSSTPSMWGLGCVCVCSSVEEQVQGETPPPPLPVSPHGCRQRGQFSRESSSLLLAPRSPTPRSLCVGFRWFIS